MLIPFIHLVVFITREIAVQRSVVVSTLKTVVHIQVEFWREPIAVTQLKVDRVILGTVAKENPDLVAEACRRFPGQIVVGIDAKDGLVAVRGWAEVTEKKAIDLAREMEAFGAVDTVEPHEDGVRLSNIFGEQKFLKAQIYSLSLVDNKVFLKALQ